MSRQEFKKDDSGKPRVELVEPSFILGLGSVLGFGAEKYEANNWKLLTEDDRGRIFGAMQRHTLAYQRGERIDPESGLSHLHHASFGLMVLNYLDEQDDINLIDDDEDVIKDGTDSFFGAVDKSFKACESHAYECQCDDCTTLNEVYGILLTDKKGLWQHTNQLNKDIAKGQIIYAFKTLLD